MVWRKVLQKNFRTLPSLIEFLNLEEKDVLKLNLNPNFPVNVPYRLAEKMEKGNIHDPLFRQFVPLKDELQIDPLFVKDPVEDQKVKLSSNLLKKYEGRALLITTGVCAMHCRYCFRQNFPYDAIDKSFLPELKILRENKEIEEVILSGGDPLSLSNRVLKELFTSINEIPHVKRIRIHTRFPIGIPERIDDEFLEILESSSAKVWFVIHCNHPKELDDDILTSLSRIQKLGIPVLNQAVLLKGVNDDEKTLTLLFKTLSNHSIFAYYLHQLDRVEGAMHFEVKEQRGKELITYLERHLPGYAVPKYVIELPAYPSKKGIN